MVICENTAIGGVNSALLVQHFPYICIHRLFLKLYRKRENCFLQMLICDKKSSLWSDATQNAWRLIRACSFCPSISHGFPRWRHIYYADVIDEDYRKYAVIWFFIHAFNECIIFQGSIGQATVLKIRVQFFSSSVILLTSLDNFSGYSCN